MEITRRVKVIYSPKNNNDNFIYVGIKLIHIGYNTYIPPHKVKMYKWYDDWYISKVDTKYYNKYMLNEFEVYSIWVLNTKGYFVSKFELPCNNESTAKVKKISQLIANLETSVLSDVQNLNTKFMVI